MGKAEYIVLIIIFNVFFIAFIGAIILFIYQYRLKKKEHTMLLNLQNEEHQKELLETQIEIQNQTMQHIGREIHDNIGQKLTLASLYTQQLAYENKAPQINESIENISVIINQSLSELRELSKSLTDDTINSLNLAALLDMECQKIKDLKKCSVSFECNEKTMAVDYQIKSVLLRIVQEFMQNSIKHSNCSNITIKLHKTASQLSLHIEDDGKGFDIQKPNTNGIGLANMKKRAAIIGGNFHIESMANQGTKLTISIPQ